MRHAFGLLAVLALAACGGKADTETIVTYGRENSSGTYMYFQEHVLGGQDFAPAVQTLPGTAAVINAVSKDRRSIGYGGIGYLKGVRALAVKKDAASPAVEPTLANVVNGSYPISRHLYLYTAGEPTGAAREFIAWTLSQEGQGICEKVGYYPLPADKRSPLQPGTGASEKRAVTVKGSDTMVILCGRWAEQYMQKHAGVQIQVTGGGSGTGIAALIDGKTEICMASRPMKDKERKQVKGRQGKEVVEIPVALDGLAVFVHEANPLKEIALDQLKAIYTGKLTRWQDLGPAGR